MSPAGKQLLGGILLAVGILIAGASGLCSLYFLVGIGTNNIGILGLAAIVGGVPFATGLGLIFAGRALIRQSRAEREPEADKIRDVFE